MEWFNSSFIDFIEKYKELALISNICEKKQGKNGVYNEQYVTYYVVINCNENFSKRARTFGSTINERRIFISNNKDQ